MASIHKELEVGQPAAAVWALVRDVGQAHRHLFPGLLVEVVLEGDIRRVTFANGLVLQELIVSVDDERRRIAYASVGGRARHHHASMQVLSEGANRCRVVWITDVLPDTLVSDITALIEQGTTVMSQALELR